MPAAGAAGVRRQAVHHRGAVGRGEHAHRDAVEEQARGEQRIGEVDRQQGQQQEAGRRAHHAPGGEAARAEPVREKAARRPGEQHPDRQRQDVDTRPQRRVGEVVAVLGQPDALQPDDQHEHQAAAGDRREERRQRAERERADLEQRQAEHRVGDAALDHREGDQREDAAGEQDDHLGAPPAGRRAAIGPDPVGDGDHDQDQAEREADVARPVDAGPSAASRARAASDRPTPSRTARPGPRSGTPAAS